MSSEFSEHVELHKFVVPSDVMRFTKNEIVTPLNQKKLVVMETTGSNVLTSDHMQSVLLVLV